MKDSSCRLVDDIFFFCVMCGLSVVLLRSQSKVKTSHKNTVQSPFRDLLTVFSKVQRNDCTDDEDEK